MPLAFDSMFKQGVREANQRSTCDSQVQDALRRYNGKTVVLTVTDDATYMFKIFSSGVVYTFSPSSYPVDMYVEMDKQTLERFIRREINAFEAITMKLLGRIKAIGIGMPEIDLIQKLLGSR